MKRIILLFLCSLIWQTEGWSEIFFKHLNVETGLSQSTVFSIYQDEFGRMWMGTRDGLNCYDGNKISIFKPNPKKPHTIFGNNIEELTGNKKEKIYIRCKYGLVELNLSTMQFTTITDTNVYSISYGTKLWSCSKNRVHILDEKNLTFIPFSKFDNPNLQISSVKEASNQLLYVGTRDHGLYVINENKKPKLLIPDIGVSSIYEDSKHNIWIASRQDGLFKISNTSGIENFRHQPEKPFTINSNIVRSIAEDNFGYYWIGTMAGLNRFDPNRQIFEQVNAFNKGSNSNAENSILSIIKDTQGSLWMGSYYDGAIYFNPEYEIYNYYTDNPYSPLRLTSPIIGKIAEDKNGNLWICSESGLNYFDRKTKSIRYYFQDKNINPAHTNVIKSISIDNKNQCLWVGTIFAGLNKLDIRTGKAEQISMPNTLSDIIYDNSIRRIIDYNDTLFLATHRGVVIYDKKRGSFNKLRVSDNDSFDKYQVIDMIMDTTHKEIWFSCYNGVYQYQLSKQNIRHYQNAEICGEKTYNRVNCIYQDSKGRIWLGTSGNGLSYYDPTSKTFSVFGQESPLMENGYIVAITETKMGYLLLGTNKGLIRLNPDTGQSFLYNNESGFPLTVINDGSLFVTSDNEIFIGGVNGMISFMEKNLNRLPKKYNINIVGIEINNIPLLINDQTAILTESPLTQKEIRLHYNHKVISFEFASSNYIKAIESDIEYRLQGFDKQWIKAGNRRLITYTNLDPGKYIFQIRNGDGAKEDQITQEISITVTPPFYRTAWAYTIYLLLLGWIVVSIFRFYISRVKLQSSLEYEKKEKQQIEAMNQSKQNFFINVSHEFRTPLTLIIGNIRLLMEEINLSPLIHKKIHAVHKNAERLNSLISELLEFNKLESGTTKVKVSPQNIIHLLNEVYLNFKEYALTKNIHFQWIYSAEEIELYIDFVQMEKVFYNLVANAFNHTPANGKITLSVQERDQYVYIRLEDTGIGMDADLLEKIFERFYQIDHAKKRNNSNNPGTGIGLSFSKTLVEAHGGHIEVVSKVGEGSVFTVVLEKGTDHLTNAKIIDPFDRDKTCIDNIHFPEKTFFEEIISTNKAGSKSQLLIIDDNPEMVALLVEIFNPIYKTIIAYNGKEGVEQALEHQPDLIISDVMMPMMSGIEMCSILKSKEDTCHIPIVLLTAKAALTYTLEGLKTGADDYITKPFNAKELIARCNNLINNRKLMQAKFASQDRFVPQLVAHNESDQILLEKIYNIVEENITNPLFSIDILCREVGLGRTNLFAKLKGVTGMTPNDFIQNIKLKRAVQLLNTTTLTVSEIAYDLGFSSPSYFIKCFKALFKKTPSEIRKRSE